MTSLELLKVLRESMLFSEREIALLLKSVGTYTIGNIVAACFLLTELDIELSGNDVDVLIASTPVDLLAESV